MQADIPKSNRLRWEISLALLLKIVLLTGLWLLIFRWYRQPDHSTDIATHLALPAQAITSISQSPKESNHVR